MKYLNVKIDICIIVNSIDIANYNIGILKGKSSYKLSDLQFYLLFS